jgi:hypothetical protein
MSFPVKCSSGDNSLNVKYHLNEFSSDGSQQLCSFSTYCAKVNTNPELLHTCSPSQRMWYSKSLDKSWKQLMKGETYCAEQQTNDPDIVKAPVRNHLKSAIYSS